MLAGSKNSPETDCLANQNDTKSSLSDFFTSTDEVLDQCPVAHAVDAGLEDHFVVQPLLVGGLLLVRSDERFKCVGQLRRAVVKGQQRTPVGG